MNTRELRARSRRNTLRRMRKMGMLYLFLLIPAVFIVIFHYKPMYGVIISFKDFKYSKGIMGSEWVGLKHYERLIKDKMFWRAFWNTLRISFTSIAFTFPMPIIFALLLNEVMHSKYMRVVQTISYLPHFLSAIIVCSFVKQVLSLDSGVVNYALDSLGLERVFFLGEKKYFDTILISTYVWQGTGWGSILYLATLSNVNPELYEAADLDGANRFHKMIHVTLPALTPVIVIQLILRMRSVLNVGFDTVYNLYNTRTQAVADVISTYTYRLGLEQQKFDYSAAIGLGQTLIGLILVLVVNAICRRLSDYAIW